MGLTIWPSKMIAPLMLLFLNILSGVSAKCVMYGQCGIIGGHIKTCPVSHDAKPVLNELSTDERAEAINILKARCPNLLYNEDGSQKEDDDIVACCNFSQLQNMASSLLLAEGVLSRCPICLRNFARQICEMNCSPEQSRFVNVTQDLAPDGTAYVSEINYRMYEEFMVNAHASCAGIVVPQTGTQAIAIMCGNAPVCTPEAWFGFTGDMSINPLAPVQVNFHRWPTPEDSMSVKAPLCNETIEGDIPCSCMDCAANCLVRDPPSVPDICTVLSINCIGFSLAIVFFVITFIFFSILTILDYKKLRKADSAKSYSNYRYKPNSLINMYEKCFQQIGEFSARQPVIAIMITTWIAFAMIIGAVRVNVSSSPLELWSAPESRSRQELNYFNSRFGPFYRAAQVFLTFDGLESFENNNVTFGPAFRLEAIKEMISLENAIRNIGKEDNSVTLKEVCYAPLRAVGEEPDEEKCVSMSVSTYLPDKDNIDNSTYLNSIQNCLNNYFALSCLAPWGGGADPEITLGGYEGNNILEANTLIINFPINNYLREEDLAPVLEWEKNFLDLMYDYENNRKPDFVEIAYGAERSIQDEIERISTAEAVPIAISYILMFVYVIFALGYIRNFKTCLLDSKVTVGVSCIVVVVTAIVCALGVLAYFNVTLTLLAINVIPFFILSVGIDNVFLMLGEINAIENNLSKYEDYKGDFNLSQKKRFVFGKMMANIGPSMFVSSITQITCFGIGSLSSQPAVKTFAIFATLSLAFLFLFQITTVVAILSIDYERSSRNRFDILCCIQKKILNDEEPLQDKQYRGITERLMVPYAKFILNWRVKISVAIIFITLVSISMMLIPEIEVGLDQEMAVPPDSYVYKYLQAVNEILRLGPPLYFVLKGGLNFTDPIHQNVVCGGRLCNDDSLTLQIYLASQFSEKTYIARSSNSWLDDFFDWGTLSGACCKYNTTDGSFCPSSSNAVECESCSIKTSSYGNGIRPAGEAFEKYIPSFLRDAPTELCNKGGLASYFSNVNYVLDSDGKATVYDSNFMAYHTTLSNSQDYINALRNGYEISANITAAIRKNTGLDVEVFPYSVFYVFFEQYLDMWTEVFASLAYCLLGALLINLVMTGFNFLITFALMLTVVMVVADMMAVMYLWSIPLNAVSAINLIVSIGISVEFCSHMAHAYATSTLPPDEKVRQAIEKVGATIITGITFTNIPIVVLAFSYTELIEVFFFRMLITLVVLAFLHGMIFFPVLLSFLNNITYRQSN